jgi:dipeptidyl aminopeptidase/acylaminoacyl peptidase
VKELHKTATFVLALSLVAVFSAGAQAKRPMTLIDMLEVPQLSDPQLSPDGKQVLFVLRKADWKSNSRIPHIWRIEVDGTRMFKMTSGSKGDTNPRWSPDGTRIAFLSRRPSAGTESSEDTAQIYLLPNSGGEAHQLTRHATAVSSITWAPDGHAIYFLASDPKTADEKERDKAKDDVYAFDENFKQTHLWRISLPNNNESKLTDGNFSITSYSLSRDGSKIAITQAPTPLFGDSDQSEVYLMDSSGAGQVRLTENSINEGNVQISPDNNQVSFTAGANQKFETYYNSNLFLVAARGGNASLILPDFPYGIDDAAWSKDGKSVFLLCNMGAHSELHQLDLATKKVKQWTEGAHALGSWTFFEDSDRHLFTIGEPTNPGDVYIWGLSTPAPARVTRVFDYLTRDFELPRVEKVQWKGADGVTVEGILTYPLNYQEGKRYPLVVNTHGGPAASDKLGFGSWTHYRPVLAAKGYAVLQPNYRGSTGYGNDFLRDMVGHYFRQAHLDVMSGVDYLIQRGIADPDRLVKMGWSGGGHMTNKIITFTDRFKAAASGAGAANWVSMYAQSDVRTHRTLWFGGTPWQEDAPISVYWEHSPLKDAWKVKTPTIFLVGERDVRVPMAQSVEMYRALKSNRVPTHLYVAPREPHGWGELRHGLFKMNVELDWFEKHAMNRPFAWEEAPRETETVKEKPKSPSQ